MRIAVIGHTDAGQRVCAALNDRGIDVTHLAEPDDTELRSVVLGDIDGVAIMLHDDMRALRYALGIEHLRPGIRMYVAMFDGTARAQIERTVPNCVVISPASIAVPSFIAATIAPSVAAVRRTRRSDEKTWVRIGRPGQADANSVDIAPTTAPMDLRLRGLLGRAVGQLRPYDTGSGVLLGSLFGLLAVLVIDTFVGMHHAPALRAFYDAARTTATISAPELPDSTPILLWASLAALLVIALTATFGAGVVHHLLSGRHVALFGRRVIPRSGHVIVAGMGQVGIRLARELRDLGIAVVGIERYADVRGVNMARELNIPVMVDDASSRRVLRRAGAHHALAIVTAGSHERDNITIAIAAQAINDNLRVIIRAGADDAIAETRSLFHIGSVIDVNGLTAEFVAEAMTSERPYSVIASDDNVLAVDRGGQLTHRATDAGRCTCR